MARQETIRTIEAEGAREVIAARACRRPRVQRLTRLATLLLIVVLLLSSLGGLWAAASTSMRGRGLVVEHSDWWDNPPPGSANILLPNGSPVTLPRTSMTFELERFLDSRERPPAAFEIDQVHFGYGSSQVWLDPSNWLDDLAAVLVAYPRARVKIVGYSGGEKPAAGQNLAGRRAQAIKDALVEAGVPAKRMTAESGGDPSIVDETSSPDDRFDDGYGQLIVMDK